MLEFKNVSVSLSAHRLSIPFSLEIDTGQVASLLGPAQSGKTLLLMAVLGLAPLAAGYITIDGELLTPGSAAYFRRMIAYVPQQIPTDRIKVSHLFRSLLGLKAMTNEADTQRAFCVLEKRWQDIGLPPGIANQWTPDVDPETLRTAMLAAVPLLHRPIVLVDDPVPTDLTARLLQHLADEGTEVLCASRSYNFPCHKTITL